MRRQRQARLRGDRSGDRVIHSAERRYFLNARIPYLECFPGLIAAVERGDARDVDETGFEVFAIIPDYLLKDEAGEVPVGLFYLRDLVVLDVSKATTLMPASNARCAAAFKGLVGPCCMMMPSTPSAIAWSTISAWRSASCRLSNTCKSTPSASACSLAPAR